MSEASAITPTPAATVAAGHEDPSVDTFGLLIWAAGLTIAITVACLVSHWLFNAWLLPESERSITPINGEGLTLPAEPRLEGIEMMSHAEPTNAVPDATQLKTYGWVDREKGIVRIPINRAMELAIERNLLPSAGAPPATTQPSGSVQAPNSNAPASPTQ